MKLSERLNVLVQAMTLSQKSGALTLDEAVKAKTAIDVISTGNLNQNYTSAINVLIEIAAASQKKGVYSLKDAHMVYLAVEGIETELQNTLTQEIESGELGEMVMRRLKDVDKVAYVRFASVYREFQDVDSFMAEIKSLGKMSKSKSKKG
jgi:transcriptional regulator NrdR family protein